MVFKYQYTFIFGSKVKVLSEEAISGGATPGIIDTSIVV